MEAFSDLQTEQISEVAVFVGNYLDKLTGMAGNFRGGNLSGLSLDNLELDELKDRLESVQEILKTLPNDEAPDSVFIASTHALLTFNQILENLKTLKCKLFEACQREDWGFVADLIDFELIALINESQLVAAPSEA